MKPVLLPKRTILSEVNKPLIEVYEDLKEERLKHEISQNEMAAWLGCSVDHYQKIECGKKSLTNKIKNEIEEVFRIYNSDKQIEISFDYIRIRFPTIEVIEIIEKVLRLKTEYMLHEPFAFYGYPEKYILGNISVSYDLKDESKGVLFEIKGKGCRQFEGYLMAQKRTWFDFFDSCMEERAVFKRIDIAIDDKVGILNVPKLIEKTKKEECVSRFKKFRSFTSGDLIKGEENRENMGHTLYIGSKQSDLLFCIYEKKYEQYVKEGINVDAIETENRFEIRLKNIRAEKAIEYLLTHRDLEKCAISITSQYLRFTESVEGKPRKEWETSMFWNYFVGEGREKIPLTVRPEPWNVDRARKWYEKQVSSTAKMLEEIENKGLLKPGQRTVKEMNENARLNIKQEKAIEWLALQDEDVIL